MTRRKSTAEPCCVADSFCEAPANLEGARATCECVACGQKVCGNCSSRRTRYRGVRRECNNCQVQLDGDDRRVMARLYRIAGYPDPSAQQAADAEMTLR